MHTFIHSIICSTNHSFDWLVGDLFVHSFVRSLMHAFVLLVVLSFIDPFIHSSTHELRVFPLNTYSRIIRCLQLWLMPQAFLSSIR